MASLLHSFIDSRLDAWIAQRRDFHKHPEVAFTEFRTASRVAERLQELGYSVQAGSEVMDASAVIGLPAPELLEKEKQRALADGASAQWLERMQGGMTGVVGEVRRGEGPVIAFRFDMDALPLQESDAEQHRPTKEGFASRYTGTMHACAHDGHTAIGLALAEWLVHDDAEWSGTIKLVFQPAEEGGRGALPMVKAGVVDGVDYFFAAHLGCEHDTGEVAAAADNVLSSTKFDVRFRGQSAHAAGDPQNGRNALLAGAAAVMNVHGIARHAEGQTYVNVGTMSGGSARNAVPDHCEMQLEVRGDDDASTEYMETRVREIVAGAAAMHAVDFTITPAGSTIAADSDLVSSQMVANVAQHVRGVTKVLPTGALGGGDDAAYFMRAVQEAGNHAGYFLIGSTHPASHHAPDFDFDECSIATGVELFARLAQVASTRKLQKR